MLEDRDLAKQYPFLDEYTSPVKKAEREIIGREKEMRSILASFHRPEISNVILLGEAGSGKAFANGTLIPVVDDRGFVQISDIRIGDMIFDENGKPTKVIGVYPQGNKPAYRVTFVNGDSCICNDEHLWAVRTKYEHYNGRPYQVKSLREMMNYGITKSVKKPSSGRVSNAKLWYVPCNKAVQRPERKFAIHPYAMGVFIGDGCLRDRPLVVSSNDETVISRVADLIGAVGYVKSTCNYNWMFLRNESAGRAYKYVQVHEMAALGDFDCVFGRKSVDKRIPREYFLGSIKQRFELLHGLMDTDGTVSGNDRLNCSFSTNSPLLASDVKELAASLGIRTSVRVQNRRDDMHVNTEYSVYFSVCDEDKLSLFSLQRHIDKIEKWKRDDRRFNKHFDDIAIADVECLNYSLPMTCIRVDSPSHLFQVGKEHIVTHNTALVQGTMAKDDNRIYLEVDLSKMIANLNDPNEMAAKLKALFDETELYNKAEGKEIVLFIDEFHQIVQLSAAAVEALKPLLADSGTRGIRVIAATTYTEFRKYISPNQPLVERLQRINLAEPDKAMTISILKGMAKRYGVDNKFYNDSVFELIYDYTNRYIPANAQPRKSILVLDAMVGWHRAENRKMDIKLLSDVIYESEGINVAFNVDAKTIKKKLDEKVLSQTYATQVIEDRLQICVAGLNDPKKPMSTMLFTGATGVGKTEMSKQLAQILFGDDIRHLLRFDMTEYANPDSLGRFRNELTARVWERPYAIVLLDEIEKACAEVTRLLLQVLDDGRLIDENNREVSFINTYIILTTNAGNEVYKTIGQYSVDDTGSGRGIKDFEKLIRTSISTTASEGKFPPELLGRINCIVPFQPLSESTLKSIVAMKLRQFIERVAKKHNVRLIVSEKVIKYLVEDNMTTDTNAGGARNAVSKLESEVIAAVARFINEYPTQKTIGVKVDGELASEQKNKLKSKARIKVFATR